MKIESSMGKVTGDTALTAGVEQLRDAMEPNEMQLDSLVDYVQSLNAPRIDSLPMAKGVGIAKMWGPVSVLAAAAVAGVIALVPFGEISAGFAGKNEHSPPGRIEAPTVKPVFSDVAPVKWKKRNQLIVSNEPIDEPAKPSVKNPVAGTRRSGSVPKRPGRPKKRIGVTKRPKPSAVSKTRSPLVRAEWALRGGKPTEARQILKGVTVTKDDQAKLELLRLLISCRLEEGVEAKTLKFMARWPRSSFGKRIRENCS